MRDIARTASLLVVIAGLAPVNGNAEINKGPFSSCPAPGYREVTLRADLPATLKTKFQDWAMPGEEWNRTDLVVSSRPNRGAYFIWTDGPRWIVGLGTGGSRATPTPWVEAYQIAANGEATKIGEAANGKPCDRALTFAN